MARAPQINYFDKRGGYYTQVNGKQKRLATGPKDGPDGPTFKAAAAEFARVIGGIDPTTRKPKSEVGLVLAEYLQWVEAHRSPGTASLTRQHVVAFCNVYGERYVESLTHADFTNFSSAQRGRKRPGRSKPTGWAPNTTAGFLGTLKAAFRWALKPGVGLIRRNPLEGYESPRRTRRGKEALITPEQHVQLLGLVRKPMKRVLVALENSGCRPGELVGATAAAWDDANGALVYHPDETRGEDDFRHKNAGKQKGRAILFTGEALTMMRELVRLHPTGPLFRSRTGGRLQVKMMCQCVENLRDRVGNPRLTPYSYRHTFATNWVLAGKPIEVLATLLGNSVAVIEQYYAHPLAELSKLRAHLEGTTQARDTSSNQAGAFRVVG